MTLIIHHITVLEIQLIRKELMKNFENSKFSRLERIFLVNFHDLIFFLNSKNFKLMCYYPCLLQFFLQNCLSDLKQ